MHLNGNRLRINNTKRKDHEFRCCKKAIDAEYFVCRSAKIPRHGEICVCFSPCEDARLFHGRHNAQENTHLS